MKIVINILMSLIVYLSAFLPKDTTPHKYRDIDGVITDVSVTELCQFEYVLVTSDGHKWKFIENNLYYDIGENVRVYFDTMNTNEIEDDIIDCIRG